VSDAELLGIGSFAMLGGLSIPALRHYDEVGVLKPARVDPHTGYRYYRQDQVREARVIRALCALDLPLAEINDVLEGSDEDNVRMLLLGHRDRLSERAHVLAEQITVLDEFIERGVSVPTLEGNRIVMINIAVSDLEQSRQFYEEMLAVEFAEERHGDGTVHLNATFGEWNTPSWFLVSLWPDSDRAGTAAIGFLLADLEGAYERAFVAGAADVFGPGNIEGMPTDLSDQGSKRNQIGLYQG
jgi:DNA-binding transcriptional MerR regulator